MCRLDLSPELCGRETFDAVVGEALDQVTAKPPPAPQPESSGTPGVCIIFSSVSKVMAGTDVVPTEPALSRALTMGQNTSPALGSETPSLLGTLPFGHLELREEK